MQLAFISFFSFGETLFESTKRATYQTRMTSHSSAAFAFWSPGQISTLFPRLSGSASNVFRSLLMDSGLMSHEAKNRTERDPRFSSRTDEFQRGGEESDLPTVAMNLSNTGSSCSKTTGVDVPLAEGFLGNGSSRDWRTPEERKPPSDQLPKDTFKQ